MTQTLFPFVTVGHRFQRVDRDTPGSRGRRRRATVVPTPMAPPVEAERSLADVFREQSLSLLQNLDRILEIHLEQLIDAGRRELGKDPIPRHDATRFDASGAWLASTVDKARVDALKKVSVVSQFINGLEVQYGAEFDIGQSLRKVQRVQGDLEEVSKGRWAANVKQTAEDNPRVNTSLGPFLIEKEPTIPQSVSARFIERNVRMIRAEGTPRVLRIPREHFKKLERTVRIAVHRGIRPEETIKALKKVEGVTARRAEVIARDQIGKHNSDMNRIRHQQLGITRYRWRTVGDDAVRRQGSASGLNNHRDREGKIYEYKNPPAGGNPGEPVQCRCWAEPVLEDLLGQEDV